jgi:transposase
MFSLTSSHQYYLYRGSTDMRKSFDGLCGVVRDQLGKNPASGEVYIFIGKRRDRVKLLHWEHGGFTLYYKRLETGTFELPRFEDSALSCIIKWTDLVLLVEGISLKSVKTRKRYEGIFC